MSTLLRVKSTVAVPLATSASNVGGMTITAATCWLASIRSEALRVVSFRAYASWSEVRMFAMMAPCGPWSSTTSATGWRPTDKARTQMNNPMANEGMRAAASMTCALRQRARSSRNTAAQVTGPTCARRATRP